MKSRRLKTIGLKTSTAATSNSNDKNLSVSSDPLHALPDSLQRQQQLLRNQIVEWIVTNRKQPLNRKDNARVFLRIVGNHHVEHFGGHSNRFNSDAQQLSTRDYLDPIEVDTRQKTILVSGGHTFREIVAALRPHRLRLRGTPEADTITVGGAVANGSHGEGKQWHDLSHYVLEFWFLDGTGSLHHIVRQQTANREHDALLVSHGTLGILARLRLQLFDAQNTSETIHILKEWPPPLAVFAKSSSSVSSISFAPYSKRIAVRSERETVEPPSTFRNLPWNITYKITSFNWLFQIIDWFITKVAPRLQKSVSEFTFRLPSHRVIDAQDYFLQLSQSPLLIYAQAFAMPVGSPQNLQNWSVCLEQIVAVIDKFAEREENKVYISYRFWCRVVLGAPFGSALLRDEHRISDQRQELFAVVDFVISRRQRGVDEFIRELDDIFRRYRAIPHLGKTVVSKEAIVSAYDIDYWQSLRWKYDPYEIWSPNQTLFDLLR